MAKSKVFDNQLRDSLERINALPSLYIRSPGEKYSPDEKLSAALAYVVTGDTIQASELCDIPSRTIRHWRANAEWWSDAIDYVRLTKNDELDSRLSKILEDTVKQLEERVANGNWIIDKNGNKKRVKLPAKDLVNVLQTVFEKRQILRGDPNQISAGTTESSEKILKELMGRFEDMSTLIKERVPGPLGRIINANPEDVREETPED